MSDPKDTGSDLRHPALIIGLGGTGKQVLLNLRRLFYEKYNQTSVPYLGHLWIDTDTRNVTLDGREMDFLMREVDFGPTEKISVELQPADLSSYYEHPDTFPHIFNWFDQRLTKHGHIRDGAGQIRSFGRLAFFRYYSDIMKRLREKCAEIQSAEASNSASRNLSVMLDNSLEAWLVFSVAGGTGSGMFLDMAFALRQQWPNIRVRAIIVLPSVFSNDLQHRIYGNAYAALMELEHYNYSKEQVSGGSGGELHRYPLAWTPEMYSGRSTLMGPVFDTAYLIGNRPRGSSGALALDHKDALCRMLAEWLYIEYAPDRAVDSLGAARRSAQANFTTALNGVTSHPYLYNDSLRFEDVFSCRYSSLGLSKIYIPVHRIETLVHHRLARDFIDLWTKDKPLPGNLDEMLERDYLRQVGVDNSPRNNDFIRALDNEGSGKRLIQRLQQDVWKGRDRFLSSANEQTVTSRVNQWIDEDLMRGQLDNTNALRDRRGALSKQVVQNTDVHYEQVVKKLHELIAELLGHPDYRFEGTREVLRRMRDRLARDKERFETLCNRSRASSNSLYKEAQTRLQWLGDLSGGFTRRTVIEVALELVENQVVQELRAQIANSAAELADRLVDYIGRGRQEKNAQGEDVVLETGLIKQLTEFQRRLRSEVLGHLNERLQAFQKMEPSPIYQDLSDGSQEVDRFYIDHNNRPVVESTLLDWEHKFFEEQAPKGPQNLWGVKDTLAVEGVNKLIERLLLFSRSTMQYLQEKTVNVLERLRERHKPESEQYNQILKRLLDYGQPWLAESQHFVGADPKRKGESVHWVAQQARPGVDSYEQFRTHLEKLSSEFKATINASADRVYAVSEMAGFPLMITPDLHRYRNEAYRPLLEKEEVLHTDLAFEKFQDLLIMEPPEVQEYVEALKIFLQALLLGIIQCERSTIGYTGTLLKYSYINREGLRPKPVDLGPFSVAVRRLSRATERQLLELIKGYCVHELNRHDEDQRIYWYTLLAFHGEYPESYFSQFPSSSIVRQMFIWLANEVCRGRPDMQEAARTALGNLDHWAIQRPPGTGLYVLKPEQ